MFLRLGGEPTNLVVGDPLLAIGQRGEAGVQLVELGLVEREAQSLAARAERVAAAVLTEHQAALGNAHALRLDDLVGGPLLEEAVLMDAGLVREGVGADDRLVRLDAYADDLGEQLARRKELLRLDARRVGEPVGAGLQDHDDLLERAVASPLADAVDRALDLTRAVLDGAQ